MLADWQDADEDRWRRRLLDAPVNLIADLDGRPAGMASGTTTGDATEREVISLWVAPFARGRGIATALVLAVVGWARDAGARRVVLEVKADNDTTRPARSIGGCVSSMPATSTVAAICAA